MYVLEFYMESCVISQFFSLSYRVIFYAILWQVAANIEQPHSKTVFIWLFLLLLFEKLLTLYTIVAGEVW